MVYISWYRTLAAMFIVNVSICECCLQISSPPGSPVIPKFHFTPIKAVSFVENIKNVTRFSEIMSISSARWRRSPYFWWTNKFSVMFWVDYNWTSMKVCMMHKWFPSNGFGFVESYLLFLLFQRAIEGWAFASASRRPVRLLHFVRWEKSVWMALHPIFQLSIWQEIGNRFSNYVFGGRRSIDGDGIDARRSWYTIHRNFIAFECLLPRFERYAQGSG